nr:transposase (putative), gypsy type [Tanacetum cinerariifolium]
MVTLGRLLPHERGLGFKPRRGGFPSGAKKEWGLSPKAKVRVLHTAQLDVTVSSNAVLKKGTPNRRRDLKERLGPRHGCSRSGSPKPRHLLVQNMSPGARWFKIACRVGPTSHLRVGSCTKQSDWMTFCTSKDDLCEKYYILDAVHPDFPGPNSRIRRSPTDILQYFQIHLSQLSVIATAKVSHFEILCRIYGFVPTVDAFVFPLTIPRHSAKSLRKDPPPAPDEFSAKDRVVSLYGVHDQEDVATPGVGSGDEDANKEGNHAALEHTEQSGHVIHFGGIEILAYDEAQALVVDKPKKLKKRKTVDGTGSFGFPSKKLMADHGTSWDASAITVGKFLTVLQDLLDKSTLAAKIGDTTAATIPLVTSVVAPIPEREVVEYVDSIFAANVQTRRPAERFVISSDTPVSNADVVDDEVSLVVRSIVQSSTISIPAILTTAVATTVVTGTSISRHENVNEATHAGNFTDSTSEGNVDPDAAGPSQPSRNDISFESFYVFLDIDSEALGQVYFPRWDVLNDYLLDDSNLFCSVVDQLTPPVFFSQLWERIGWKIGVSVAFVFAAAAKDAKIAKLSQDLSQLQLSCDYLSIKASTLECEKDKLIDQVSLLEVTCSELRREVEFYPRFLPTLVGRRWIRSRDARLLVTKCLHSLEYMTALGGDIRCAIKKGMHDGLATDIDHESQKETSIIDIMDLIHLEGSAAETMKGLLLQPSSEQLMVPIHRLEDQAVIEDISLSDSLEVAYNHVQRLKGDATACCLSLMDTMVPLVEPLSVRSLTGEVSTFEVPATTTAVTTEQEKQDVASKHAPVS